MRKIVLLLLAILVLGAVPAHADEPVALAPGQVVLEMKLEAKMGERSLVAAPKIALKAGTPGTIRITSDKPGQDFSWTIVTTPTIVEERIRIHLEFDLEVAGRRVRRSFDFSSVDGGQTVLEDESADAKEKIRITVLSRIVR